MRIDRRLLVSLPLAFAGVSAAEALPLGARDPRQTRVETEMPEIAVQGEAPVRASLQQWMDALGVPGLSVAVIHDYRTAWASGYGVSDAANPTPVGRDTLFQAGSIAKPVTAVAAMRMVEQGQLSLDADFNDALSGWRMPESAFTAHEKVTLRRLLAHTAGVTPGGFQGYEVGAAVPGLTQILNGEAPANNPAAGVVVEPGSTVAYSGLGYTVLQLAMVERSGQPFPRLLDRTILRPLNMRHSSFEQPLPSAWAGRAASGHDANGAVVTGRWRVHPEMAAAGLWTTPSDLALLAIEVARAKRGESHRVLSQATTRQMLTQERNEMSLGWVIDANSAHGYFAHNGGNVGFRAHMRMLADSGDGVVILTNSDNGADLFRAIAASVANVYEWPEPARPITPIVAARVIASQRGVERALAEYRLMREQQASSVNPGDLNGWGYALLGANRVGDAVKVFTDNAGYYADNAYAYDALGEALLAAGDEAGAARNYRRSLELDPSNDGARVVLERLGAR